MARKPNHQFERRRREQARAAKAAARRKRKEERAAANSTGNANSADDPDLVGIVVGPQPKDEISKVEARLAVERAMNPGKALQTRAVRCSKVFVGNLDFNTEDKDLHEVFTSAGFKVHEAEVIRDRDTGQSRGFAFVEVEGLKEASRAVSVLDGVEISGRNVRVNVADRNDRR